MREEREPRKGADSMNLSPEDTLVYWKRISAGGEMKSAIKKFLDDFDQFANEIAGLDEEDRVSYQSRVAELRESMERWCNIE